MAEPAGYWLLIAVLTSTIPLAEPLAMRLLHAAIELLRRDAGVEKLSGDLARGEVRNLGRSFLLGSVGGPGFEADLDTPHGSGRVRFLLTREALERAGLATGDEGDPPRPGPLPN